MHPAVPKLNLSGAPDGATLEVSPVNDVKFADTTIGPTALDLVKPHPTELSNDIHQDPHEGDSQSQMFLQEVAILQMQAEGWKAEWSIAMQENERLRMALYDAQTALEALPTEQRDGIPAPTSAPACDGELQWRELCTSIARGADEEKAMLLEELSAVRAELERQRSLANAMQNEQQQVSDVSHGVLPHVCRHSRRI
jgi:hypothetical protein